MASQPPPASRYEQRCRILTTQREGTDDEAAAALRAWPHGVKQDADVPLDVQDITSAALRRVPVAAGILRALVHIGWTPTQLAAVASRAGALPRLDVSRALSHVRERGRLRLAGPKDQRVDSALHCAAVRVQLGARAAARGPRRAATCANDQRRHGAGLLQIVFRDAPSPYLGQGACRLPHLVAGVRL